MTVQTDTLAYGTYSNVKLTPRQKSRNGMVVGGLAEPEAFPDYARYNREGAVKDIASLNFSCAPRRLEGTYIYGGFLMKHFGHVLTECVHRLWVSSLVDFCDLPIIFMTSPECISSESLLEDIRVHFRTGEIILVREDAVVEHLVIAESGKQFGCESLPAYVRWISRQVVVDDYLDLGLPEKICILRGHLPFGKLIGEATIETWLAAEGYHILRPEDHDLSTQLAFLCSAKEIIFSEGSALHLLDILPPLSARVAVIKRRPTSTMEQTTLAGKVKELHIYYRVTLALHYNIPTGRESRKALSYVKLADVAAFLLEHRFLEHAPDLNVYEDAIYSKDLSAYFERAIAPRLPDTKHVSETGLTDQALERLLEQQLYLYEQLFETKYTLYSIYMRWAMDLGVYDEAVDYANRILGLYPHCELTQHHLELAKSERRQVGSLIGRMTDRLKRAMGVLRGGNVPYAQSPPTPFFKRKL